MSEKTFEQLAAEEFAATNNPLAPLRWRGVDVFGIYTAPLADGVNGIRLEFMSFKPERRPGISGRVRGGTANFSNESVAERFVLWADSAPRETSFGLIRKHSREPLSFRLWGRWIDRFNGRDVEQAWSGNTGFLLHRISNESVELRFNLGRPAEEPTFDDLVVRVTTLSA